jgi:hypothetical protein
MYDNAKSIAFAYEVKIDALSGNIILDVKLFFKNSCSITWIENNIFSWTLLLDEILVAY